ncbi:MAG: S1 RNA-binding domain-containing protein [Candidatus Omnitrophica bacterium]|nr:S1 RNA-binding domain-containing protein [Candidatus Omnitrophota bacterium]MBU1925016.1 S1 RNA-binding domain-containing protein [Candidatus Omnitrophota bacterium]
MKTASFKVGDVVEITIAKIHTFGAQVTLPDNAKGLIHISQISDDFVKEVSDYLKVGDRLRARIKKITPEGKIDLTLRKAKKEENSQDSQKGLVNRIFQQKLDEFLKKNKQTVSVSSQKSPQEKTKK